MTSIHEVNYVKLLRVVPQIRELLEAQKLHLNTSSKQIMVTVEDHTKYTTSLAFTTQPHRASKWLSGIYMQVRMYHDARVAEVTNYQHNIRFNSRYEYPNKRMHLKNEKQQINYFLGEWLDFCIDHGYILRLSGEQLGV